MIKIINTAAFCALSILLINNKSYAAGFKDPSTAPCEPSPFGTYCEIHPKYKPKGKSQLVSICGRTAVAINAKQRHVLNAYLKENKNMILRFKVDNEFIDAPCS